MPIDRHEMWQMLRVYAVEEKLFNAAQSFYVDSRACVPVGNDVSWWFLVNVGLRQGCVMSPWLFDIYIYGWCGSRGECYGAWERAGAAECEWWQV